MALKLCRECHKEVSTGATKCPHCGVSHPTSRFSKGARGCLWLIGLIFVGGMLSTLLDSDSEAPTQPTSEAAPASAPPKQQPVADPAKVAIDAWLTGWSKAQASSVQATCRAEPGCDPNKYNPSSKPETSFGWDGATSMERIEDWAKGLRYHVIANGNSLLIYLDNNRVVGVYALTSDGGRSVVCRDAKCAPSQ